jgi:hypothetical protein
MARYLKNTQLKGGSYAIQLPLGSNSLGPDAPQDGQFRYNVSNSKIEFYYNGSWHQVAKIGSVPLVMDEFTGDNATIDFTMSQSESAASSILVTIAGIYQTPTNNYTVGSGTGGGFVAGTGTTIRFTSAPPAIDSNGNPNKIIVIHNINSTNAA